MRGSGDVDEATETDLSRSEARYRSLVEATAMDVWRADPDGGLVTDMPRWRGWTGQSLDGLLGDGWVEAIHPDDRERVVATWRAAARSHSPYECQYRIRTAHGDVRHVHARAVPIVEDGELIEWVGTTVDVTETRRADEERDAARRRLAFLAAASAALARSLDVDQTLEAIGRLVVPEIADWCTVHLRADDGTVELRLVRHVEPESERQMLALAKVAPAASQDSPYGAHAVIRTGQPQLFPEISDELLDEATAANPEARRLMRVLRPRTGMSVPLVARGETLGALTLARADDRRYTEAELALIGELAQRAALSLANARLYARERGVAMTLQRSLLPQRVAVEGLETAYRYVPGSAETEVGGDWVDVIPLSTGRVALVIGDVMGRGVRAAAVMGQMRTAVRAYALLDLPPSELLSHLDELVQGMDIPLVTCVYAVYDPGTRSFCVANAGHPPPVLLDPSGRETLVTCGAGIPLGVGGVPFRQGEVELEPGATLLLYTDGLVESPEQDLDQGIGALRRSAARHAGADAEELPDRLLSDLRRLDAHDDDIALLVVRVPRSAGPVASVLRLEAHPVAVGQARKFVAAVAEEHGWGASTDVVCLLASELVTNAIRHAGGEVELRVRPGERALYVEVADADRRVPRPRTSADLEEAGRGLMLVEALAARWGVRPYVDGKVVWFELGREA